MTDVSDRILSAASLLLLIYLSPAATAENIERGKQLHDENCTRCHQAEIYSRDDRIVHDVEQLKRRVALCEQSVELLWFEEEVNDVSAYLNTYFYQFGIK